MNRVVPPLWIAFALILLNSRSVQASPKVTPTSPPTPPPHIFSSLVPVAPVAPSPENRFNWLTLQQQQDLLRLLPAPPAPDSLEDNQDLSQVIKAQDGRTADDITEAQNDDDMKMELMVGPVGSQFTEKRFPNTRNFLRELVSESDVLCRRISFLHKRDRPYVAHMEVKPLFTAKGYGYPDDHALKSHLLALVLQQLFPDHGKEFLDKSDVIGQSRVNAGVANPTDVTAGKTLAEGLLQALTTNDQFQKDLQDVEAEIKKRIPKD